MSKQLIAELPDEAQRIVAAPASTPSLPSRICRPRSSPWWSRNSCLQLEAQLADRDVTIELERTKLSRNG